MKKSLGGATGQWTFVHKVNGIYGPFSLQHKKNCVDFSRLRQKLVIIVWLMPQK